MSLDTTKADDIALVIEEAIVSGELEPGTSFARSSCPSGSTSRARRSAKRFGDLAALGLVSFVPNRGVRVRTISREELHEAFMVRAELEALATEVAAAKMTPRGSRGARGRRAALRQDLQGTPRSRARRGAALDHGRLGGANHAFHDVIYRVADLPLVEQLAKSSRRSFSGPPCGRPATTRSTASTRRTPSSTARSARRSSPAAEGSAGARARARHFLVRAPRGDPRAGRRHLAAAEALRR